MGVMFLGGGNMASAMLNGLLSRGFAADELSVVERDATARTSLIERFGVAVTDRAADGLSHADTVVLAVKPQDMQAAILPLSGLLGDRLVVSIAAGLRAGDLSRWLGGHPKLVRAMPNTPALIGRGITALFAGPAVSAEERNRAERILGAVGEVLWVADETLLDPVTALSGSGPAYVFWFIEHLAAAGAQLGLEPAVAGRLALATVCGAAELAAQSDETPAQLRARVTSKGGTTEAALKVFESEAMAERLARALKAASARGTELGDALGAKS